MSKFDYLIVGAGFSGIVLAERLASINKKVLLIEKKEHIGGNCYDFINDVGVLVHKYGPHYFRAKSQEVIDYLSMFTDWIHQRYKVRAKISDKLYSFPINKHTIEQFFKKKFNTEEEVKSFVDTLKDKSISKPKNAEEQVLSMIGKELYEAFFKGYTKKQWGIDPKRLDASVTARIPIRFNANEDYIIEDFQAMPKEGFSKMFNKMLTNKNITLMINTPYNKKLQRLAKRVIWTGPIDQYYNYKFGKLPYRSLHFKFKSYVSLHAKPFYQEVGQVNFPEEKVPFTRIVEIKQITKQDSPYTTISIETPTNNGDPYYPMPTQEAKTLYNKYAFEASKEKKLFFIGRLATYRYLNMDQCVEEALKLFDKIKDS